MAECQNGAMTTDNTAEALTNQGITGGTTAVFSMKQAAQVAGLSVSTLRRRRADLIAAGADISPDGWKVPMTALVACGLIAGEGPKATSRSASDTPRPGETYETPRQTHQLHELTAQVRELEREVGEWRRRAEVAEARAEERGRALDALRIANETERMALRMLTAGTTTASPAQLPQESTPVAQATTPPSSPVPETAKPASPENSSAVSLPEERKHKGFFSRILGI